MSGARAATAPHLIAVVRRALRAFDNVGDLSAPSPTERAGVEAAITELRGAVDEADLAASMAHQLAGDLGRRNRGGFKRRKV